MLRAIETWPLTVLHSFALAHLMFGLYYPMKAYGEIRNRKTVSE
jgi:hypothetical protein